MTDALRAKLADAGRVLAMEGHGDYVAGHISVRLPDEPDRFLMKPAGIGIEEMRPDNIITVDLKGRKTDGAMPRAQRGLHPFGSVARTRRRAMRDPQPPDARGGVFVARQAARRGR
ncbi:MAG: class II aldolase/adducin family protein [Xanthobacteraceae bacterium]